MQAWQNRLSRGAIGSDRLCQAAFCIRHAEFVFEIPSRPGFGTGRNVFRCSGNNEFATIHTGIRPEVDDPVGALHNVEIVFNDDEAVALIDQTLKQLNQQGNVIKMQACGGFIQQKQSRLRIRLLLFRAFDQMTYQLQSLGFASGERVERLAELEVAQARLHENVELISDAGEAFLLGFNGFKRTFATPLHGLLNSQAEHIMDAFAIQQKLQCMGLITLPFALGAGHIEIAEELHFDLLITCAPAALASTFTRVE